MIVRYDGTLAGLLTVCQVCDVRRKKPADIQRAPYPQAGLFDEVEEIVTDPRAAADLRGRIVQELSPRTVENIRLAFLSEHPGIEMMIWRYLTLGWKLGPGLDSCLAHPDVHAIHCWSGRTVREGHRLQGWPVSAKPRTAPCTRRSRPTPTSCRCSPRTLPGASTARGCCTTSVVPWAPSARVIAICWGRWRLPRRSHGRPMRLAIRHSGAPSITTSPFPTASAVAVNGSSCR